MKRRKALAKFLGEKKRDITEAAYGENTYDAGAAEFLVLTDSEADYLAKEYIKDSLWAFNASFLAGETGLPEEAFGFTAELCEGANDAVLAMVESTCGLSELADNAMALDGRGHFLAQYDGDENEYGEYFIYRTN